MNELNVQVSPENGKLIVREGKAPDIYVYQGLSYQAHTAAAFAALVKAKASKPDCVIFCSESGFTAILDDRVQHRPKDVVTYPFRLSTLAAEWAGVFAGKGFDIKSLAEFLARRTPGEVADLDALLYAVQNFRYVTNIAGDFSFADRNNYVFSVKVDEAESTIKVPKTFRVSLELLQDSGFTSTIEVEVEVYRPASPNERPGFKLTCPKYDRYHAEAVEFEKGRIDALLEGYLVVEGEAVRP